MTTSEVVQNLLGTLTKIEKMAERLQKNAMAEGRPWDAERAKDIVDLAHVAILVANGKGVELSEE
jgi:hypothetical protein